MTALDEQKVRDFFMERWNYLGDKMSGIRWSEKNELIRIDAVLNFMVEITAKIEQGEFNVELDKKIFETKNILDINDLEKVKHYIELLIELSANKSNEYCRNCTDINEGVFVKKLDCECQKVDKSVPCVNCRNIFGVCGLGGRCKCANAACKCQKEIKHV